MVKNGWVLSGNLPVSFYGPAELNRSSLKEGRKGQAHTAALCSYGSCNHGTKDGRKQQIPAENGVNSHQPVLHGDVPMLDIPQVSSAG